MFGGGAGIFFRQILMCLLSIARAISVSPRAPVPGSTSRCTVGGIHTVPNKAGRACFERLHDSDFRISKEVIQTVLRNVGEL